MTTPDGLRQGADYVQDLVEAAQKSKVSHGFPEKQLPQFDAEVVIWAKALLAKCDEARARADTFCLLYTSPSPRDGLLSRMPSSA